jgi:hypothetical protein
MRDPIIPPEVAAELATTIAAAFVAGLRSLGRDYDVMHAELAELRDELHALSNRIESATRHMGLPDADREAGWQATEPAPGWTLAGPYRNSPRFRAFAREPGGHVYRLGHDDYEAAAEWIIEAEALENPPARGGGS